MIELEILFGSGQGILIAMKEREDALKFMQKAMSFDIETDSNLYHLSTEYEEILIDLGDISFIRLKKEMHPRLTTAYKIPAQAESRQQKYAYDEPIAAPPAYSNQKPDHTTQTQQLIMDKEHKLTELERQRKKIEDQIKVYEDEAKEAELAADIEAIEIAKEIEEMKHGEA